MIIALGIASLIGASLLRAEEEKAGIAPDLISFFPVQLQCPAAPQIGCGLVSKPILLELQREPAIAEAWLNETGTVVAGVWRNSADAEVRTSAQRVLQKHGLTSTELGAAARAVELKSFVSGEAWYHSTDVDTLSKQEARIIAARLVRRVQRKVRLSDDKAKTLEARFYDFMASPAMLAMSSPQTRIEAATPALLKVARDEHLSQNEVGAVQEAIAKGFLPVAGDKEETKGGIPDCCSR